MRIKNNIEFFSFPEKNMGQISNKKIMKTLFWNYFFY